MFSGVYVECGDNFVWVIYCVDYVCVCVVIYCCFVWFGVVFVRFSV